MSEEKCYVEKWHYDNLFAKYSELRQENVKLKDNLYSLRDYAQSPSMDIIIHMKSLGLDLEEQMAFLTGVYCVLSDLENEFKTMEETEDGKVSSDQQQDPV